MKVALRDEKDLIHNTLELLDSGDRWVKHSMKMGNRFCLLGALMHEGAPAGTSDSHTRKLTVQATRRIQQSIAKLFPRHCGMIPTFNDSRFTKWEDVQAVLEDAMK